MELDYKLLVVFIGLFALLVLTSWNKIIFKNCIEFLVI